MNTADLTMTDLLNSQKVAPMDRYTQMMAPIHAAQYEVRSERMGESAALNHWLRAILADRDLLTEALGELAADGHMDSLKDDYPVTSDIGVTVADALRVYARRYCEKFNPEVFEDE